MSSIYSSNILTVQFTQQLVLYLDGKASTFCITCIQHITGERRKFWHAAGPTYCLSYPLMMELKDFFKYVHIHNNSNLVCTYINILKYAYAYVHACICVLRNVHIYFSRYTCMHTCTCIHGILCMHACVHTYIIIHITYIQLFATNVTQEQKYSGAHTWQEGD